MRAKHIFLVPLSAHRPNLLIENPVSSTTSYLKIDLILQPVVASMNREKAVLWFAPSPMRASNQFPLPLVHRALRSSIEDTTLSKSTYILAQLLNAIPNISFVRSIVRESLFYSLNAMPYVKCTPGTFSCSMHQRDHNPIPQKT